MSNISDLDDKAHYLRITWSKMINYASTFSKEFMALEDEFKSGKYGPDWDFERWLGMKCGMSYTLTYRMLAQVHRVATDAERERIKAAATAGKPGRKKKVHTPAPPAPVSQMPSQAPPAPAPAPVPQMRPQAQAQPDSNVVPLPTPLDRLAAELRGIFASAAANRAEWRAIQMRLCTKLVEIRDQLPHNTAFGKWCAVNGFGPDVINHQDRAAAIKMGRDPVALHQCLETTNRSSLQLIYANDFPR